MILTIDTVPVVVPDPGQTLSCILCNSIISFDSKDPTRLLTHFRDHHQVHLNHNLLLSINLIDIKFLDEVISSGCKILQETVDDSLQEQGKKETENLKYEAMNTKTDLTFSDIWTKNGQIYTEIDDSHDSGPKHEKFSENRMSSKIDYKDIHDSDTDLKLETNVEEHNMKCEIDIEQNVKNIDNGQCDDIYVTHDKPIPKGIDIKIKDDIPTKKLPLQNKCPYCKKEVTNSKVLSRHIRKHHGSEKYTNNLVREEFCHECNSTVDIDNISLIEHHYTVHDQKLKCKCCSKLFRSEFRLSTHIKKRHGSENSGEILLCHCGFSTHNLGDYERHKNVHGNDQCEVCQKTFGNKYMLKQHVETVHENKIKWKVCHICGQSCRSTSINDHIFRYHSTRTFNCPECEYTNTINTNVKRHYKNTHESVITTCEDCGKNVKMIAKHKLQSCSARKNKNRIVCYECDKTFGYHEGLKRHVKNIHMNIKDYICALCDYKTGNSGNLNGHISRVHKEITGLPITSLSNSNGGTFVCD